MHHHTDTAVVQCAGGQRKLRLRDERVLVSAVFVIAVDLSELGHDVPSLPPTGPTAHRQK